MEGKIKVDPTIKATFEKWLARGDGIAVFRNHDLSHPECGREVFVPSHSRDQTPNKVGTSSGTALSGAWAGDTCATR